MFFPAGCQCKMQNGDNPECSVHKDWMRVAESLADEVHKLRALESAVRRDLATYLKDYPDGTRFALTEIALQYLPPSTKEPTE